MVDKRRDKKEIIGSSVSLYLAQISFSLSHFFIARRQCFFSLWGGGV